MLQGRGKPLVSPVSCSTILDPWLLLPLPTESWEVRKGELDPRGPHSIIHPFTHSVFKRHPHVAGTMPGTEHLTVSWRDTFPVPVKLTVNGGSQALKEKTKGIPEQM